MNKARIVILGAGYAGMMAALRLAGKDRNQRADVTLINASDVFYERVRMHQVATNQTSASHSIRKLLGKRPITFIQGWVRALDLERQVVQVDGQGEIGYDYLVYTLGSIPAQVKLPGVHEHLYAIGSPKQAAVLRERLIALHPGSRVAVVGGGLTGIETATEIAEAYPGLPVSLVTAGTPGQGLSQGGQAYLTRSFAEMGVTVYDHTRVAQVEADALVTESGERIPFEVGIWAGSFEAAPLAREAGLAVNAKGQMRIDRYMRSISHPAVYGAGDGAAPVEDPGAPLRMACAVALPMAAHTADNLLARLEDRPQQPFNFGYVVQCVSLGRRRGLLQFVHPDDSPKERIVTGRMGAIAKEMIVQYAYRSLPAERILPGAQVWLGKGQLPAGVEDAALPPDAKPVHS
ncbi:MAG: FAD-dependent oxidoreductase [Anaerolineae bacterium]|nr:FAD-dependent oxidoreductase [Anaerolineae bacterium]